MSQFTSTWLATRGVKFAPTKVSRPDELEADLHAEIIKLLKAYGTDCYYVHSRMDRPTTCGVGVPDFIGVLRGTMFGIEVKKRGGKVTPEQAGELMRIRMAGGKATAVWSVGEVREFLAEITAEAISKPIE